MFLTKTKRSRYYQIIYSKDGKQTSKSTHTANRKKAEIILEAFQRSILELPEIPQVSCSPRLKEFEEEYIEMISLSCSRGYLIRSVKPAFKHLLLYFGDIQIHKITNQNAERFLLNHFQKAKYSAALYLRVLKASFNKAINWGYVQNNPLVGIRLPKFQANVPVFINVDEFKLILNNTDRKIFKDIFLFAYLTGMRSAEIMNLKWNEVDLENNLIRIGSKEFATKSKKIRVVPIITSVRDVLMRNYPGNAFAQKYFVFDSGNGYKFSGEYVSKKFKSAVRNACLPETYKFHSLRSSYGSLLLKEGISIGLISKLLCHSSSIVTERHYLSVNSEIIHLIIGKMKILSEKLA